MLDVRVGWLVRPSRLSISKATAEFSGHTHLGARQYSHPWWQYTPRGTLVTVTTIVGLCNSNRNDAPVHAPSTFVVKGQQGSALLCAAMFACLQRHPSLGRSASRAQCVCCA